VVLVHEEAVMKGWLRRIRGAVGMGVSWAAGWAVFGLLIGVTSVLLPGLPWDAFFKVFDAPLPALAVPGFVSGVLFSGVLGVAGRRRRFDELSLPRFAALGALGGVLLSLVPAAMVAVGLATIAEGAMGLWQLTAVVCGPLALLGAASASGSLLLARRAERRDVLGAGAGVADVGLTDAEKRELLGGGG
jgi:hypothetical protein